jgi:hypothetical protein
MFVSSRRKERNSRKLGTGEPVVEVVRSVGIKESVFFFNELKVHICQ